MASGPFSGISLNVRFLYVVVALIKIFINYKFMNNFYVNNVILFFVFNFASFELDHFVHDEESVVPATDI